MWWHDSAMNVFLQKLYLFNSVQACSTSLKGHWSGIRLDSRTDNYISSSEDSHHFNKWEDVGVHSVIFFIAHKAILSLALQVPPVLNASGFVFKAALPPQCVLKRVHRKPLNCSEEHWCSVSPERDRRKSYETYRMPPVSFKSTPRSYKRFNESDRREEGRARCSVSIEPDLNQEPWEQHSVFTCPWSVTSYLTIMLNHIFHTFFS